MNEAGIKSVLKKMFFFCLPTQTMRSRFIMKHSHEFHHIGRSIFWQSRLYPADPDLISIGDNVFITADVSFITHDTIRNMLNIKYTTNIFKRNLGCIEIGDNVMIGSGTRVLPNVRIGSNVIIGAGSIITKDIPDNSVATGIPCKVIGSFDDFVNRRKEIIEYETPEAYWKEFYNKKGEKSQ